MLGSSLLLASCRDHTAAPVHVVLGPAAADDVTFAPQASLAELIEISPTESALLVSLSSVPRACDGTTAPEPNAVVLSLRFILPGGARPEPGKYPIAPSGQPSDKPRVIATVKLHGQRRELLPGGEVELRALDVSPQGSVEGLLALEYPGDAEHPATRVAGRFSAQFCRINRLR